MPALVVRRQPNRASPVAGPLSFALDVRPVFVPPDTTPPTVTLSTGITGSFTDVPTTGYSYSFTVDEDIKAWKIKLVASTTDPHLAGQTVESGGAAVAGLPVAGTITYLELRRAGYTGAATRIVKFFAQDLAGNWSDSPVTTAAAFPSYLRVADGLLVDENNNALDILKGFNVHVAPTVGGGEGFAWAQAHFTSMADAGARIARMVCHWDVFQKSAGVSGIDATAIASLDTSIARCAAAGMYVLLEIHLNVSRTPAWAQTGGSSEWDWFRTNGQTLVSYLASRYGDTGSPDFAKNVIALCPNEPPTTQLEFLVAGYETIVPWYRDIAPGWLVWVASTGYGQGTPYALDGDRSSARRYLRLDTNHKGIVLALRDYFVYDPGAYGPYQANGAIAPSYQAPGTYTANFGGAGTVYPGDAKALADHATYMQPWISRKAEGNGRFAIAIEEFAADFTGNETLYIRDVVRSWRLDSGGPGTVAEMWWNYDVASRVSNQFSPRPAGAWRQSVLGWLSNPTPPLPFSSLSQFDTVSRAESTDATSYSAIGTSSWLHTPNSAPTMGVVVAITQPLASADQVSGVTYGGVALNRVVSYASATARVYLYFNGVAIPDGPQTVTMTTTGTAAKQAHCYAMLTGGRDMVIDSYVGGDQGAVANPTLTDTFTASLASQVGICAHAYGGALPPSQTVPKQRKDGLIVGYAHDPGAATAETYYRSGDPEQGSDVFGYDTLASAATLMGAVVVKEQPPTAPLGSWENLIPDPSFEGQNTNGFWTPTNGTLSYPTGVSGTARTYAQRLTATTAPDPYIRSVNTLNIEAGWTYTYLLNVLEMPASGRTFQISIEWKDRAFLANGNATPVQITSAGLITLKATAPINTAFAALTAHLVSGGAISDVVTMDAALFVQGDYTGTYFDGATAGCSWSGPADNSSSYLPI